MYLGFGVLIVLAFAWWLVWSKLCDIERKQFEIHDEMSLSLKYLEEQLHLTQSMIERIEENIPPVSEDVKEIWKEQEFLRK
ncbi:hypothetical protein [Acinetobacter ursingii]|uniref:hypothetical protein n=1 Tax=Acinetobacter ursingii TaxID=108980 RepID=UPI00300B198C